MRKSPQVSVVIPVYQAESFIGSTLASIAVQTRLPDEVVVVDDGSTDRTVEVVRAFSLEHTELNIRLVRASHCGPGAARNRGVQMANGTWIAFLDSDDLWMPTKIEYVLKVIEQNPDSNFICHNEKTRRLNGTEQETNYIHGLALDRPLFPQIYIKNYFSTSAVVCRRDLLLVHGGFSETLSSAQDYELWMRMAPSLRIYFVSQVLGIYVHRRGNITSSNWRRRLRNELAIKLHYRARAGHVRFTIGTTRVFLAYTHMAMRTLYDYIF